MCVFPRCSLCSMQVSQGCGADVRIAQSAGCDCPDLSPSAIVKCPLMFSTSILLACPCFPTLSRRLQASLSCSGAAAWQVKSAGCCCSHMPCPVDLLLLGMRALPTRGCYCRAFGYQCLMLQGFWVLVPDAAVIKFDLCLLSFRRL